MDSVRPYLTGSAIIHTTGNFTLIDSSSSAMIFSTSPSRGRNFLRGLPTASCNPFPSSSHGLRHYQSNQLTKNSQALSAASRSLLARQYFHTLRNGIATGCLASQSPGMVIRHFSQSPGTWGSVIKEAQDGKLDSVSTFLLSFLGLD